MNELDQKINAHFPGLVVRKDLVKTVKGNAIVPSYVLEYLLGQYLKVVLDRVAHSHSKGSVFVYIPGRKVLFAGDILFTEYYVNMGSSNIDGWAKTIDHLMGLDINHIIPGHGPLSEKKQLADMRDYLFIFDEKAKELSTSNSDIKSVAKQIKGMIPQKPKGERMIASSLRKYIKKK